MYMILKYGAVGVNSCSESRQLVTHSNKDLFWIYGHLYQIKESNFSQKLYDASLSNRLKDGPQWVSCVVFITTLLWHCTLQEHVFNGHSVARMLASCQWSSVLGTRYGTSWPRCGQFKVGWLQLPQLLSGGISLMVLVFDHEIQISTILYILPFGLNLLFHLGVCKWLKICIVNSYQQV